MGFLFSRSCEFTNNYKFNYGALENGENEISSRQNGRSIFQ